MGVSVVVPTVDRVALLDRCLQSLADQDDQADEVIVVHDGAPAIASLLRTWQDRLPLQALQIRERGVSAKRNAGWRAATGDLVAFTDDDCAPMPSWVGALRKEPADLISGPVVAHPDDPADDSAFGRTIVVSAPSPYFPGANIAVRRSQLEVAGGFDESLSAGEDTDLAWRLKESGALTTWCPEAVVQHAVRPVTFPSHLRSLWRWQALPLVLKRHPALRESLVGKVFWKQSHPLAALALVGLLATPRSRRAALLVAPLLVKSWRQRGLRFGTQVAIADVAEVAVVAVGSVRHGRLLL